jgi:release factor glutamine methyltransferase
MDALPIRSVEMKTVLDVLQATTGYFEKRNIENPRLNAEHLVGHALGKKRLELYLEFERPLSEAQLEPLRELVRRRGQGEPLQHVLGTAEFFGRSFLSDDRALIPRPETEQLVELVLAEPSWQSGARPRMVDVGTGSGVIALTLAAEKPELEVEAFDISGDALALAGENAVRLGLLERVRFSRSDLLSSAMGSYDLLVANLPYIRRGDIASLAREVQHDPALALDGGEGGFDLLDRLAVEAKPFLKSPAVVAFEIGHDQSATFIDKLRTEGYQKVRAYPDYQGVERFVIAHHG